MTRSVACVFLSIALGSLQAAVINTNNVATVTAFQAGATVASFEGISGRTPETITAYTAGNLVSSAAFIFNQIAGVQFSVGGAVGTNQPALYTLSGGIAGDATSAPTVLGPVDFDFTTKFNSGALIEIFFPVKVSKVGFWLNPSLGNALLIAADTNFAFSGQSETTLETLPNATAGNFVGIERPTADIGGFKVIALGSTGFTLDDFTFGGGGGSTSDIPEPGSLALFSLGAVFLTMVRRAKN